jgi:hypothetical protein
LLIFFIDQTKLEPFVPLGAQIDDLFALTSDDVCSAACQSSVVGFFSAVVGGYAVVEGIFMQLSPVSVVVSGLLNDHVSLKPC